MEKVEIKPEIPLQELSTGSEKTLNTDDVLEASETTTETKAKVITDSAGTPFDSNIHKGVEFTTPKGRFKKLTKNERGEKSKNNITGKAVLEVIVKLCDVYIDDKEKNTKNIKFLDEVFIKVFDDYTGDDISESIINKTPKFLPLLIIPLFYAGNALFQNQPRTKNLLSNLKKLKLKIKIKEKYLKFKSKFKRG